MPNLDSININGIDYVFGGSAVEAAIAAKDAAEIAAAIAKSAQGQITVNINTNGDLIVHYEDTQGIGHDANLGQVGDYAIAKANGYTGTIEEWVNKIIQVATDTETAEDAANDATQAKDLAEAAKNDAEAAQSAAETAKTAAQAAQTAAETAAARDVTAWLDEHAQTAQVAVIDNTLTIEGAAAESSVTGAKIADLKSALYEQTIFADTVLETGSEDCSIVYTNNAMNDYTGEQSDASPIRASTPNQYFIPVGCNLYVKTYNTVTYNCTIYCFSGSKEFLGKVSSSNILALANVPIISGTRYIRSLVIRNDNGNITPQEASSAITFSCIYDGRVSKIDNEVSELQNALYQQTIFADTVFEQGSAVYNLTYTNNAMNSSTGQQSDASNIRTSTPELYYIPIETELHIICDITVHTFTIYCFDEDFTYLGYVTKNNVSNNIVALKTGTRWMRFDLSNNDNSNITPEQAQSYATYTAIYTGRVVDLDKNVEALTSKVDSVLVNNNLLAGLTPKDGYYNGSQNISADYKYFEKIPVEVNKTYTIYPRSRMVYIYDASGSLINYINQQDIMSVTAEGNGFAYVTYYTADNLEGALFYEENAEDVFGRDSYALSDNIIIPNNLTGKKWAVLGDSFTAGADSGTIQDGTYAGQKIVYPYLIGNRTGINVLSFFAGGRTLAYPANPGSFDNSVTCPGKSYYYQNIPADTDYVTIYLGINDSHHRPESSGGDGEDNTGEIPIGTITDATTATFYGAWNVVLTWLKTNRPFAHVGIIVSNGCETEDYRTATIAIAKKYGIPYIDLNGDDRTLAMIRPQNNDISEAVKTILLQTQAVNYPGGNYHPNNAAHNLESTIIENFLRSI